jgi:hypothetical protein
MGFVRAEGSVGSRGRHCVRCPLALPVRPRYSHLMVDLGAASENEVVLAFLRAEIDAPRYQEGYVRCLQGMGLPREDLIDRADLGNTFDNHVRAICLASNRGYGLNAGLFQGYPNDIVWRRFEVALTELGQFIYANFHVLREVSGASRFVSAGAQRVLAGIPSLSAEAQKFVQGVPIVVEKIRSGQQFPDLVAVRDSRSQGIVIMEGHTRATAHVIAQRPSSVSVLIGSSARMHEWWLT